MNDTILWCEKYRPKRVQDCILPEKLKSIFQGYVDKGFIPNLLLAGGPGVGKTSVAKAMLEELGCDYIVFNGSLNVSKDVLRNQIQQFASTVSITGTGRKYIILDEADYLDIQHVQPALRSFMEEFSENCGFILTCNWKNKLIEPLHSRSSVVDFTITKKDKPELAAQFLERLTTILDAETIPYDKKVLIEVIVKYFPDWRRVINETQHYASSGRIDTGMLASLDPSDVQSLVGFLKKKDFKAMRTWIGNNMSSTDTNVLFRQLYDRAIDFIKPESIPALILILAEYQYKAAFVVDQEINLAACMTQIMVDIEFL